MYAFLHLLSFNSKASFFSDTILMPTFDLPKILGKNHRDLWGRRVVGPKWWLEGSPPQSQPLDSGLGIIVIIVLWPQKGRTEQDVFGTHWGANNLTRFDWHLHRHGKCVYSLWAPRLKTIHGITQRVPRTITRFWAALPMSNQLFKEKNGVSWDDSHWDGILILKNGSFFGEVFREFCCYSFSAPRPLLRDVHVTRIFPHGSLMVCPDGADKCDASAMVGRQWIGRDDLQMLLMIGKVWGYVFFGESVF